MQKLPENFRLTITRGEEFFNVVDGKMLEAFLLKELKLSEDHFLRNGLLETSERTYIKRTIV